MTRIVYLLGALALLAGGGAVAASATDDTPQKVFVCKYVGIPGVDERLQTGQNPISVSVNAIPDGAAVGAFFTDEQGRSFVLAFDSGQPEPDVSHCPHPDSPPPDACPDIPGTQPPGTTCHPPPFDQCPNIPGDQPEGTHCDVVVTPPPPPPPPRVCPDGGPPNAGKDGQVPGSGNTNDDCDRSVPPPPPAPPPPGTTVVPAATPTPPPAAVPTPSPAATPPKATPKPKPKPKTPAKTRTPAKTKTPTAHVCVPLKDGTQRAWWKGGNGLPAGCYPIVKGSG